MDRKQKEPISRSEKKQSDVLLVTVHPWCFGWNRSSSVLRVASCGNQSQDAQSQNGLHFEIGEKFTDFSCEKNSIKRSQSH